MKKILIILMSLSLIFILSGCISNSDPIDDGTSLNSIQGTISLDGNPVKGVLVSISELDKSTTTDENGVYQFSELQEDTYTLIYKYEEMGVEVEKQLVVSGGKSFTKDIELAAESQVNDAKVLVHNLNNTGMQLEETATDEMNEVNNNLNEDVVPKVKNLAVKNLPTAHLLAIWSGQHTSTNYNSHLMQDFSIIHPGKYEITYDETDDTYTVTKLNYYNLDDEGPWNWEISYTGDNQHQISISLPDIYSIMTYDQVNDKQVIDISEGQFELNHTINSSYEANLTFNINCTTEKEITIKGENGNEIYVLMPIDGSFDLQGSITDNLTYENQETEETYNPLGEMTLDTTLVIDDPNNSISFDGSFSSEYIYMNGYFDITFDDFIANSTFDLGNPPNINEFNFNGELASTQAIIKGNLNTTLTSNVIEKITLDGSYENNPDGDWSNEDYTRKLTGSLDITPDFSNYDPNVEEITSDNYIAGTVDFSGSFENSDFAPITLDIVTNITDYRQANSTFRFTYDDGSFIDGGYDQNGGITINNNNVSIEVYSNNLKFDLSVDTSKEYIESVKVGTIKNYDQTETYAELYIIDGQLEVHYQDNTTQSLFY